MVTTVRAAALASGMVLAVLTGCTAAIPPPPPSAPTGRVDPAVLARVTGVIGRLSASATASPGAQQALLLTLVDPGQRAVQGRCSPAGSTGATLSFEPAYGFLAPAPQWHPGAGTISGPVYVLPALIRVHRDGRITGTDVGQLHLSISPSSVGLTALCAS